MYHCMQVMVQKFRHVQRARALRMREQEGWD
jgi:hypothetical protein